MNPLINREGFFILLMEESVGLMVKEGAEFPKIIYKIMFLFPQWENLGGGLLQKETRFCLLLIKEYF